MNAAADSDVVNKPRLAAVPGSGAKRARPGLKIVVVDPRRTDTVELADLHLAIQPGTAVMLFHGMLDRGVYFAPALYEAGFMSAAHSDADIEATIEAAASIFKTL